MLDRGLLHRRGRELEKDLPERGSRTGDGARSRKSARPFGTEGEASVPKLDANDEGQAYAAERHPRIDPVASKCSLTTLA